MTLQNHRIVRSLHKIQFVCVANESWIIHPMKQDVIVYALNEER
ncbi:hypothetical protein [Geobacillus thermodenitrificans]|nr:hypothetical protein [Geobacillus thermodenitrificans]